MSFLINSHRFGGAAFSPTNLPNLKLWYDFSDSAKVTLSGSEVTAVASKGTDTTALVRIGTGPNGTSTTQNALAVANFDGTTEGMWLGTSSNTAVVSQPLTVILAAKVVVRSADKHLSDTRFELGDRVLISGDTKWRMFGGGSVLASTADSDTSFHVITAIFNGASSSLRIDGTQVASGSAGTNALTQRWCLPNPNASCHTGDVLVDGSALGGTDLSNIETFLKTKWGTP